ncbi:glycoside hydrolase family 19 protein [Stagnimonas aquatica]|uniref:Glycoside hydrolase family 19 protein n=1 Tax=Stagnimonas aquatica TaxID=2689987 RepID=A0A3N0VLV6_9GAMM|nr:glycoside hydrolase family 19 protein [Stagnimonas aquatica]ROH93008.1 glycoside hydrolase family 19 protein [Stagnimonas aquatica]
MQITQTQLSRIMPRNPDIPTWTAVLNSAMAEFQIASRADRIAAFLAQIAHESGEMRRLVENLHYSSAKRICAVWPKRFPTEADAAPYVAQPEKLANRVYADRMGNGDAASGDGWRFRGRGLLQVTGRGTYKAVGTALGLPLTGNPDLLLQAGPAARSAAHYWRSNGLNELADDRSDDDDDADFVTITVKINGGKNGLTERRAYWASAKTALNL